MNRSKAEEIDETLRLIEDEARETRRKADRVIVDIRSLRATLRLEQLNESIDELDIPF